jgi:hypothetical protein
MRWRPVRTGSADSSAPQRSGRSNRRGAARRRGPDTDHQFIGKAGVRQRFSIRPRTLLRVRVGPFSPYGRPRRLALRERGAGTETERGRTMEAE